MAEIKIGHVMTELASVHGAFSELVGKPCCRQRVGEWRSLSIGFGEKVPHGSSKKIDPFYGEWEIGTYSSAWRIVRDGQILCASKDLVDSTEELDEKLQRIPLGTIVGVQALHQFDISVKLTDGVSIEFICVSTDDDEMFHIFGPNRLYVEYKYAKGWNIAI